MAEAGSGRGLPHDRPQGLPREAPAAGVHEQSATVACARIRRTDLTEVAPHPLHGFPTDGDETLLPPLAGADHIARGEVDVVEREAEAFGGAHAGGVEELEHRSVADAARMRHVRRFDERGGRLPRKRSGKRPRPARCVEMLGGIAPKRTFADQMLVRAPERRDTSRDAGGPETAGPQALEVFDDVVRPGPAEAPTMIVQKLGEVGEIAAVGVESIPGRPPL